MIDQVYNAKILEFAGNISRIGELENAGATVTVHSKLCGSKITVWLSLADGKVSDFSHDVKACALGQATSAIMAEHVIGSTTIELRQLRNDMSDMLRDSGTPPVGRFEDLKYLEPVKDYRARHASTMLTFDAVVKAIDQIEKAGEDAVSI
jgi:NifU-like protein involved in Fe-S cluster formation